MSSSRVTAATLSSQRKSLLKKNVQRDSSIGERLSDDEAHRRPTNSSFAERDRPRRFSNLNELRRTNNQLGILREILSSARDIDKFMTKTPRFASKPKKLSMNGNVRPTSAKSVTVCDQDESSGPSDHSPVRTASRARSASNNRSTHNVSFISEDSNRQQLKKLLDLLWVELNDLERLTGVRPGEKASTNTCSSALAVALLHLTGHVKECLRTSSNQKEMKTLKDQLTIVIRNQLDFQQKIENQMCTLQTMMQTICQLVNSEIISRRTSVTPAVAPPPAPDRYSYHASKVPVVPKTTNTAMDELLTFAQRMNNGVATSHPAAKRPMSAVTTNSESQSYETVKPLPIRRTAESESTRLSPLENHFFDTTSPSTETLLEKILQERLRLVQHMAEFNEHTADLPSSSN